MPQGDFRAGFDFLEGPVGLVMAAEAGLAHRGAEELFRLDPLYDFGQAAGVIHFHVVGDDIGDFFRVDDFGHALQHLRDEALFDRVDQGDPG